MVREKKPMPKKLDETTTDNWKFVANKAITVESKPLYLKNLEVTSKHCLENEKLYYIGNLCIGIISSDEDSIKKWDRQKYILVNYNSQCFKVESYFEIDFLKDIISSPNLYFDIRIEDNESIIFELSLKLLDENVPLKLQHKRALKRIFTLFFNDECAFVLDEKNLKKKHDIDELYKAVRLYLNIQDKNYSYNVQHPNLKPTLRPYQAQAVEWMLNREHNPLCIDGEIHPSYHKITLPKNEILYFNAITMHATSSPPVIQCSLTGGILADEMGLGKTVEVLACILCNPRNISEITKPEVVNTDLDTNEDQNLETLQDQNLETSITVETHNKVKYRKKIVAEISIENQRKIKGQRSSRFKKIRKSIELDHDYVTKVKKVKKKKRIKRFARSEKSKKSSIPQPNSIYDKTKRSKHKNSHRIIYSSSEDELDNIPLAQRFPIKKVKTEKIIATKFAKQKQTSSVRQFCNLWYESKLAEVNVTTLRNRPTQILAVQCLCGDFQCFGDEVTCQDCMKKQHRLCVSYTGDPSEYYCPQCWETRPLIKTGATLIVTPESLSKQWISEIKRHLTRNGLRVLVYKGVRTTGYLYPVNISEYDLVLTTYAVLQTEIRYVSIDSSRSMRFEKKYHVGTSPLLSLEWWRVCLDEAQLVEGATSCVANMARKLHAVHRWAVSGTPAQRGIPDLHGLILFLGIEPYTDHEVWKLALYNPYCKDIKDPMHKFLSKIMWRTCKKDILDQINIPKQTEIIHWLKFSAVEDFFYKREHEMCQDSFQTRLRNYDVKNIKLSMLDRITLTKLLMPLLSIRQACTHPKVVRGKYLTTKNNVMSMDDLLEALISKNELECSDILRAQIAALNGLAGIHIIEHRYNEAGECYRDVLRLIDQHKNEIQVDTLPHLHTLHNLSELLTNPRVHLPPTLRDDKLKEEAVNLEETYIHKHVVGVNESMADYLNAISAVTTVENDFSQPVCGWFAELVHWTDAEHITDDLLSRIESSLQDYSTQSVLVNKMRSSRALIYEIYTWWEKVDKNLRDLRESFKTLNTMTMVENKENLRFSDDCVNDAVTCHLRPVKNGVKKKKCFLCKIETEMLNYECLIFLMNTKKVNTKRKQISDEEESKTEGSWKACEQEIILKSAANFGRVKRTDETIINEGELHLELCDELKKEFRDMRRLWTYYGDLIASQDEISMCKERLRIRLGNEELPILNKKFNKHNSILKLLDYNVDNKLDHINVIEIGMIDAHFASIKRDKLIAEENFTKKLGTLAYLKTLRKEQDTKKAPDPCPICTNPLQDNWSILSCGHSFCLECIHNLLSKYCSGFDLTCSVCRRQQPISDISYVRKELENDNDGTNAETSSSSLSKQNLVIKGSFSTKIEAIIKCTLDLYRENNDVKLLIFSTWTRVLNVIRDAFIKNGISFLQLISANSTILEKFKDKNEHITALLLPISLGGKGLNLIEATHVFLVEPLMNPGEELQAIGRVHRIGQTKPTFVHRFLIKDTIEESLHNAVSTNSTDWENNDVTLAKLSDLFENRMYTDEAHLPSSSSMAVEIEETQNIV